ncbi:hypothetical protein Tco_0867022 [Tanacetum coccineum]
MPALQNSKANKKEWNPTGKMLTNVGHKWPPSIVSHASVAVVALIHVDTIGTPSSTSVDQDAPSASTLPTTEDTQAQVLHQEVKRQETLNA